MEPKIKRLQLNRESLRRLDPADLRKAGGGVVTRAGAACELVSLALSCEIIACF